LQSIQFVVYFVKRIRARQTLQVCRSLCGIFVLLLSLSLTRRVHAEEYEILKQKKCAFLVTPASGLSAGQTFQAKTNSGKSVVLTVRKRSSSKATLTLKSRDGRCAKISGSFSTGEGTSASRKFSFGIMANGGVFSIRQKFTPTETGSPVGEAEASATSDIIGLSGIGFAAGPFFRYSPLASMAVELAVSGLTASPTGKTVQKNNDDFIVSAKATEIVLHPAFAFPKCVSKRIYCKAGGIFGLPLSSRISIKSTDTNLESKLNYKRYGAELSAGFNLNSVITVNAGGQLSLMSGTFNFSSEGGEGPVSFRPFTAFIFGGIIMSF
jgi:hypothetical protein